MRLVKNIYTYMKDVLLQILLAAGTALIGFIFGWRKNNTDICGQRLDQLESSIKVYNVIIDDMSKKIEELTAHIEKLEGKIKDLITENKKLKKENGRI